MLKYNVILSLELKYPIGLLCDISGVSRTAYYRFKNKPLRKVDPIEKLIIDIYNKSLKRFGYRQIKSKLKSQYGLIVNHKKILRIMKEYSIKSIIRVKKRYKTRHEYCFKGNILNREFQATKPGEKYVTDITYIPTRRDMVYLCTVIDLFNNEPVAWKVSDKQDKSLSIDTIKMLSKKVDLSNSMIHSDQGVHYTNYEYVKLLERLNVKQSMSRKGNCWDNAKAESFFSHYKSESIKLMKNKIQDLNDVVQITDEYMKYYIEYRPQRKLGDMTPSSYKLNYLFN